MLSTGLVSSRSPNTFLKCVAMFLCWTTLQWSSMDKITGYLRGDAACQLSRCGLVWVSCARVAHQSSSGPTHSDVTKACSLMVWSTSRNLILEVRVWPW